MIQEIANSSNRVRMPLGLGIQSRRNHVGSLLRSDNAMSLAVGGAVSEMMGGSVRGAIAAETQAFVGEVKDYASKLSFTAKALSALALGLGGVLVLVNGAAPSGLEPRQVTPIEPVVSPTPTRVPVMEISCMPLKNGRQDKEAGGLDPLPGFGEILLKYREALLMEAPTEAEQVKYRLIEARVGAEAGSIRHVPNARVKGDDGCVVPSTLY